MAELESLFRDRFNFTTTIVELDLKTRPQHQLNLCIADFAMAYDGPSSLLVVCYVGHAVWKDLENYLELRPSLHSAEGPHVRWDKAESMLRDDDLEADTLVILDVCYWNDTTSSQNTSSSRTTNSQMTRTSSSPRKFELLSSSRPEDRTVSSEVKSFIKVLIDNLEVLADEYGGSPFSTFTLNQRMCIDSRMHDSPSHLWSLSSSDQHIFLAPVNNQTKDDNKRITRRPASRLALSLDLRDQSLNQVQIEYLVKQLAKAFNNKLLGVRGINFHGIKPISHSPFSTAALVLLVIIQWKKIVQRRREERSRDQS
jgi:hypothetical protein